MLTTAAPTAVLLCRHSAALWPLYLHLYCQQTGEIPFFFSVSPFKAVTTTTFLSTVIKSIACACHPMSYVTHLLVP